MVFGDLDSLVRKIEPGRGRDLLYSTWGKWHHSPAIAASGKKARLGIVAVLFRIETGSLDSKPHLRRDCSYMIRLISTAAFLIVLIGVNISPVRGQTSNPPPISGPRNPPTSGPWNTEEQRLNSQMREANNSIWNGPDGRSNFARDENNLYAYDIDADLAARREKILQPKRAERATYSQFLKQPHVGLVRLFPQTAKVVTVDRLSKDKTTAPMFPGGGAFYSFTRLNHSPGFWADLMLKDGNLEVSFGPDIVGAITMLGDVPIESLTSDSPGVNVLERYTRPVDIKQAKSERERFKGGVTLAGYELQTQVPVHENKTYALRSIAYGRSDLLVAVRVVKQNEDGTVLLLWKRLDKFSAPKLKAAARK